MHWWGSARVRGEFGVFTGSLLGFGSSPTHMPYSLCQAGDPSFGLGIPPSGLGSPPSGAGSPPSRVGRPPSRVGSPPSSPVGGFPFLKQATRDII